MKKNNIFIITILSVIIIGLISYTIYLNYWNKEYKSRLESMPNVDNNFRVIEYDCSFTKTYRVVDLLDGYIAEVPEWSYIALDSFQNHAIFAARIPSKLKEQLQENKYYEFTYTIKGKDKIIKTMEDINENLVLDDSNAKLKVTLGIKETEKVGLEQLQESICQPK